MHVKLDVKSEKKMYGGRLRQRLFLAPTVFEVLSLLVPNSTNNIYVVVVIVNQYRVLLLIIWVLFNQMENVGKTSVVGGQWFVNMSVRTQLGQV